MKGGDILNSITIPIFSGSTKTDTAQSGATATPSGGAHGALFKAQLGDSVAVLGGKLAALAAGSKSTDSIDAALERAVQNQLDRGISLSDVIARLAGSLAASVAAQLGISPEAAQQRLSHAFTQALQSLGTGPPQTNAERASALVSRLRQIAELATRVTNGDPGQPIRTIAGTSLDANSAKAAPAPQPDSILREALTALAAPASPVPNATIVASTVPAAVAAPSDGRVVALPLAQAIATGGDTLLGRMLVRASLADQGPPTPVAGPIASTPIHRGPGDVSPAPVNNPPGAPAAGNGTSTNAVLDAFAAAFATELARTDAAGSIRRDGDSSPPAPVSNAVQLPSTGGGQPATPFAIPIAHDTPATAPAASALPQPQHADANAVIEQILRGMAIRTTDGQSEVRLRLVPEQLGDVSVRLIVSGGSVDASITAHTADAQNALAGGQNQLAKTLADAGLKLQSFTVGLAGGGLADARDHARPNDSWTRSTARRLGGVAATDADESDDTSLLAVPSIGPPIYSARSLPGAFNRLV